LHGVIANRLLYPFFRQHTDRQVLSMRSWYTRRHNRKLSTYSKRHMKRRRLWQGCG